MDSGRGIGPAPTVVGDPAWVWALLWGISPVLGAGAGLLVRFGLGWASDRPNLPVPGWVRLVGELPDPWLTGVAVALGIGAGLGFAAYAASESLTVTVGADLVRLRRGDHTVEVPRDQIRGVFVDHKDVVVLGVDGAELAREPGNLGPDRLEPAFTGHGYRWHATDPYAREYARWVPDLPQLPPGADALFAARQQALERGDQSELRQLRTELARLRVVVKDRDKRQHWRLLPDQLQR